jgi:hypothetical protein
MIGFLPWEEWLPPYVFGPLICIGSIVISVGEAPLSWWQMLGVVFCVIFGALGTGVWIATGRNIFVLSEANEE